MKFVTGIRNMPWAPITVGVGDMEEIFASTCLMKLSIPRALEAAEQEYFNSVMRAAIRVEGKAFTSY